MGLESIVPYYRLSNQGVREHMGGLQHSASLVLANVDLADIAHMAVYSGMVRGGSDSSERAQALRQAGAQGIILCTNTMNKMTDIITQRCPLPLLHIADATTVRIYRIVGGGAVCSAPAPPWRRRFIVSSYQRPTSWKWQFRGLTSVSRHMTSFFTELCQGILRMDSRRVLSQIIAGSQFEKVEGIVLGCTAIGLLLSQDQDQVSIQLFDTTAIHATAAV